MTDEQVEKIEVKLAGRLLTPAMLLARGACSQAVRQFEGHYGKEGVMVTEEVAAQSMDQAFDMTWAVYELLSKKAVALFREDVENEAVLPEYLVTFSWHDRRARVLFARHFINDPEPVKLEPVRVLQEENEAILQAAAGTEFAEAEDAPPERAPGSVDPVPEITLVDTNTAEAEG